MGRNSSRVHRAAGRAPSARKKSWRISLWRRLAKFKLPRQFEFLDQPLPKGGTGKILKRELRERFWAGKERRVQGIG